MHTSSVAPGRHTIRKGCRQTGQWIARLCLALPLLALPLAHASEPPAADEAPQRDGAVHTPQRDGAVHITRAELLTVPGTGYSDPPRLIEDAGLPSNEWREISLPHTADRELVPTPEGGLRTLTDWYRLDLSGLAPSAQQRLLYLPRWKTLGHIAVYGDGVLLYQSHGSPIHNGYNHPLLLPLNASFRHTFPGHRADPRGPPAQQRERILDRVGGRPGIAGLALPGPPAAAGAAAVHGQRRVPGGGRLRLRGVAGQAARTTLPAVLRHLGARFPADGALLRGRQLPSDLGRAVRMDDRGLADLADHRHPPVPGAPAPAAFAVADPLVAGAGNGLQHRHAAAPVALDREPLPRSRRC
jgi:hypothetical protein